MKIIKLGLLLATICAACGLASAQANQCYVITYERDPETKKQAGPRIQIGAFDWHGDKPLVGVLQDQSTGVFIAVRAERVAGSGRTAPKEAIRLAISFVAKPGDGIDEAGAAEAEATYGERWKQLSVSKNIKVGNGLYTYHLSCDRGGKKTIRPDVW
jgi:hypothetical protein